MAFRNNASLFYIYIFLIWSSVCVFGTNNTNNQVANIRGNYFIIDVDTLRGWCVTILSYYYLAISRTGASYHRLSSIYSHDVMQIIESSRQTPKRQLKGFRLPSIRAHSTCNHIHHRVHSYSLIHTTVVSRAPLFYVTFAFSLSRVSLFLSLSMCCCQIYFTPSLFINRSRSVDKRTS